mgnify:CR=1 FL=1
MTGEAPVLGDIEVGDAVFVCGFSDGGRNIEKRLRDIGFSEGSLVECVGESPLGGMAAYCVRGAVIALRREDAAVVMCNASDET